ncbi:hypothetical protein [Wolbachia endosymbiont of Cantharis cryptica]|uniref:hypothetical protein n=1 Tax=Wolbachia endosymbiont of Cantharis cryptica TaxID=3066132 RepID=UPI00376F1886
MLILNKLLKASSSTETVEKATDFNPAKTGLIEGEGVAYGLSYQDDGDGSSIVELLIILPYKSQTYKRNTGIKVANEFKDQLSLILIKDSAEIDKIGIIAPEEGINEKGEKYIKGLMFSIYGIKQLANTPLIEHLGKTKLQKNINSTNLANEGNSYSQPKAVKVGDDDVIVIAHNLKDQTLVSWYLRPDKSGKLKALAGKNGVTERKLFKFDNPGQLALDRNMMFYSQVRKRIIKDQEVTKTYIFKFNVAEVVQNLKDGKGVKGFSLGNITGQIDNKALSLSSEHEISFLQHVKRINGDDLVAFLENDQSANKQRVRIATIFEDGSKSNSTAYEFEDPIEQLYVKDDGQDSFIVTAVSGKNIITFNHQNLEESHKVTIIPADSITLSDFVNIINGRLTPSIVSSSTLAPTEKVVTTSTVPAITSTTKDAIETTKLTTEAPSPTTISTSATSKPITTQPSTVESTPTTEGSTVTSDAETSTVKPTTEAPTTVAPTSAMSKPLPDSTTQPSTVHTIVESTTEGSTVTSKAKTSTVEPTPTTEGSTVTSDAETSTVEPTPTTEGSTVTSDAETSTGKPISEEPRTAASTTIAPTSATSSTTQPLPDSTTQTSTVHTTTEPATQPSTVHTIVEPTTEGSTVTSKAKTSTVKPKTTTVTSQATTVTTTPTNLPITNSENTTTPPTRRAIARNPNEAEIIAVSLLGAVVFIVIIIGYIVYKLNEYRQRNAVPVLALTGLTELDDKNQSHLSSSSSSSDEINTTELEYVSVGNSNQSSSPSPKSSRSSESENEGLAWDSNL